jgi:hypothetical protein
MAQLHDLCISERSDWITRVKYPDLTRKLGAYTFSYDEEAGHPTQPAQVGSLYSLLLRVTIAVSFHTPLLCLRRAAAPSSCRL